VPPNEDELPALQMTEVLSTTVLELAEEKSLRDADNEAAQPKSVPELAMTWVGRPPVTRPTETDCPEEERAGTSTTM
jgi:hypothetical protein